MVPGGPGRSLPGSRGAANRALHGPSPRLLRRTRASVAQARVTQKGIVLFAEAHHVAALSAAPRAHPFLTKTSKPHVRAPTARALFLHEIKNYATSVTRSADVPGPVQEIDQPERAEGTEEGGCMWVDETASMSTSNCSEGVVVI